MAQPEQHDYFFVVEEGNNSEVYARGEGKNVLSSLARLSLVHLSAEDHQIDRAIFSQYGSPSVYEATESALADFEADPCPNFAGYTVNTLALSDLMHRSPLSMSYDERLASHNNALIERIREGVRSPQSVSEELSLQLQDRKLLESVSRRWFNREGWMLTPPYYRRGQGNSDLDSMQLYKVQRNDRRLDATIKETLFDAVPRRGQAYSAQRAPLNYHKTQHYLNERRPFLLGLGIVQDVYGFVAYQSKEFVPVVTSSERPERQW